MRSNSWLPISLYVVYDIQIALCMTVETVSGAPTTDFSSFGLSGFNSTTRSASGSRRYLGTGTTAATPTRSSAVSDTAVTSGPLFGSGPCPTNVADYPSFIMPTINPTESCDIYGPLCQTGSIAVGIGTADDATTTTTVPCSCYLTAQSLAVNPTSSPWRLGFGRSAQCLSLLNVYARPSLAVDAPIFSDCPKGQDSGAPDWGVAGRTTLNETMPRFPNPNDIVGMPSASDSKIQGNNEDAGTCCGLCDVQINKVQVFFFPEAQDSPCGNRNSTASQSATEPSITAAPNPTLVHRALYPRGNASIAVSSGFTFTYPSIYMEIGQAFSMTDDCGILGKAFPSTMLAFAPGSLSTVSYDISLGADFGSHLTGEVAFGHTITLDPRDLACPTWGLSGPYNPDTTAMPYLAPGDSGLDVLPNGRISQVVAGAGVTIGPPYFPVIVLPTAMLSLDPAWARCSRILKQDIPLFDPPRTLAMQDVMNAPAGHPPAPPVSTQQAELVPPTSTDSSNLPAVTQKPGVQTGIVQEQADPTEPGAMDAGIPATAVTPATTSPPPKVLAAAVPTNDPELAVSKKPMPTVATIPKPPANIATAHKDPILSEQLNAALAVSTTQAAISTIANPPSIFVNDPVQNLHTTQQASIIPPPIKASDAQSLNAGAASAGAGSPSAVTPNTPKPGRLDSEASAPAFAGVRHDPGDDAGPPATSSEPGFGVQVFRPFAPASTVQKSVEVAPVLAGSVEPEPLIGAQVAQNLPISINSPQQQQTTTPSDSNPLPASIPSMAGTLPALPAPSKSDKPPANPQNTDTPPPINIPNSNPSQGQASSPPQQELPQPPSSPAITINSQTYTRNSASAYIIASHTLLPGGPELTIGNPSSNSNDDSISESSVSDTGAVESQTATTNLISAPTPIQISLAGDGNIVIVGSSTQQILRPFLPASSASQLSSLAPGSSFSSTLPVESDAEIAFTINSQPFDLQPTPLVTRAGRSTAEGSEAVTLATVGQTVTIASEAVALESKGGSVVLVDGSGSSVVAVATGTGAGVVVQPAPTDLGSASASTSAVSSGVGMSGAVRIGQRGWGLMGVMTYMTVMIRVYIG